MRRIATLLAALTLAACAIRPKGEPAERERAAEAGAAFVQRFEERALPELPPDAVLEAILLQAALTNAELERAYWEWRAAIERIPQESTTPTAAALSLETMLSGGMGSFLDRSSFTLSNDPMANIPWPKKLAVAGRIALDEARAAGLRFEKARLELRERVTAAWWEWTVLGERIRLKEADLAYLEIAVAAVEARVRAGAATQGELLKLRVEEKLARNGLETLRSELPGRRAELNALLSREPDAPVAMPGRMDAPRPADFADDALLARAADRNPELLALSREVQGRTQAIELARLQYLPDFALGIGLDPGDWATRVMGMITMPIVRRPAIEGAIEQARADLRATEAMRRQVGNDLAAQVVLQLYALRNADRQIRLFEEAIVPESDQAARVLQGVYAAGRVPLQEFLDSLRVWIDARAALAEVRAEREKSLARLESLAAVDTAS
jgi:outer membrane protein TolC